ncbi:MAG: RND transporter [Cycloclasticus sp. symbiont of Bathymodiolus heckerae]|nr:MAG: RND transporter [Cycloclasticus sp. symbiont of Bathymodiolus heckerae]
MHRVELFFSEWVIKHRLFVLVMTLVLVGLSASGLRHLGFDNDFRAFFGEDNPDLIAFNTMEDTYVKSDNVFIVIAPKQGDVFQPVHLMMVEKMTADAWQMPYSRRVDSIQNFQNSYAEEDDLIVEDLYEEAESLAPSDIEHIRKVALNDPLLVKRLVSPDGKVTAVNVTIQFPKVNQTTELQEVVTHSRELVESYKTKYPDVDFYVTGVTFLNNAFVESGQRDVMTLVPLSFLVMVAFLFILLKSGSAVFGAMLVIVFSDLIALGLAGYVGIKLTPASISSTQMIMILAVANSVHMLVALIYGLQQNEPKLVALKESVRVNVQPIFLTSITTMIGFLGLNFSEVPPFNDLGNIVAMGVFATLCLSLTFLPALMSYLPIHVKQEKDPSVEWLHNLSLFVIKHHRALMVIVGSGIILSACLIPLNKAEDQFVKYFDESVQFRTDSDFANKTLGGLYQVLYSFPAKEKGAISEPEYLERLDAFNQWISKQPETINTYVLTDTMRRLNKNMHGDDPDWYVLPAERELAAQYILLYEMSLPYGLDLNNQVNVDKSATRMVVGLKEISTVELLDFENRVQSWLSENMPSSMQARGTGPLMMFSHISEKNIKSMLFGSVLALIAISFILIFVFKSMKIGLLSLVPNLVPIIIGFGLWGLIYAQVNMGLAIVVSMTLGIVVDDTVHFLSKYLRARREKGYSAEQAVTYAFTHVGKALVVSSIVLSFGFAILMLSPFALNSAPATLTTWVIIAALAADFTLLPALLLKFDKDEK